MPVVNTEFLLPSYESDLGLTFENIPVKFEDSPLLGSVLGVASYLSTRGNSAVCGGASKSFRLRKLIVTFSAGGTVQIPVPSNIQAPDIASQLLALPDVACVAYEGEEWASIPSSILGGGDYSSAPIQNVVKPNRITSSSNYVNDDSESITIRRSFYAEPAQVLNAQTSCGTWQQAGISCGARGSGLKPRHFIGRVADGQGGTISRKIYVEDNDPTQIQSCGNSLKSVFNCLGYKGESTSDVLLSYGN